MHLSELLEDLVRCHCLDCNHSLIIYIHAGFRTVIISCIDLQYFGNQFDYRLGIKHFLTMICPES